MIILGCKFFNAFLLTVKVIKWKYDGPVCKTNVLWKLWETLIDNRPKKVELLGYL